MKNDWSSKEHGIGGLIYTVRKYKKRISNEKFYFLKESKTMYTNSNSLSYKEISELLQKEVSTSEFMENWSTIGTFLKYADGLPTMLEDMAYFDDEFIVDNRLFLADIFGLADSLNDVLGDIRLLRQERDSIFNRAFEEAFFQGLDEETTRIMRAIFGIAEEVPMEA